MPGLLKSTRFDLSHLVASLFFLPWPNPALSGADLMTPVVVPGWTLNFEIFFYLLFGLTLALPRPARLWANVCLFGIAGGLVAMFNDRSAAIAFYEPSLVLEFVAGLGLGAVLERDVLLPPEPAWLLLAPAVTVLCWLDSTPHGLGRFAAATLPSVVAVYALASLDLRGRWPPLRLMGLLGDASFSIYLTHIFVLAGLRTTFATVGLSLARSGPQALFLGASLILSCVVGILVFRAVEQPLGKWLRSRLGRRPARGSAIATGDVVLGCGPAPS